MISLPLNLTGIEQARVAVAQAFAEAGAPDIKSLLEMLTDPSWVVRRSVIGFLAEIGEPAVAPLCDLLQSHRDSEARIAAIVDTLVASKGAVEAAVLKLSDHPDAAVMADVVQILGRRHSHQAIPALIRLTKHVDDNVAVGSIEALGRIGGRAAVEALIELVGTGNFFRTFPAIELLGRSGDPRAVEPLTKLLKQTSYLPEAARALGRSGEKSAVKPLLNLLKSQSDSVVRLTAKALWDLRERFAEKTGGAALVIDELVRLQVSNEIVRRLNRVLPNADGNEAIALCKLLGAIGSLESAEALSTALDSDSAVAESAAEALKKIGKNGDENLLRALREGDSSRRKVLLPIVTRTIAADEVALCFDDADAEVRALACDTMARIGNGAHVAKIFALLADNNLRVVHSATAAIQALGTRETRQLAVAACRSENPVVRRAALRILGYFGDESALEPMLAGLEDGDVRVREAALQGLPYLEDPRALEALILETKSTVAKNRALAIRALGQVPKTSERIFSLMLKGLADSDAWVRYYACQSLGRAGFGDASEEIASLLSDPAGQVRVSAVEALSHLSTPAAHQALRLAVDAGDIDVHRAALVGLGIARRKDDLLIILKAANATDVPTRLIALSALMNFQSPMVLGALSSAGSDADEQVRSAAIGFLSARPEQEATEVLTELLASELTKVRAKAALLMPSQSRVAGLLVALQSADDELAPQLISILSRVDRPEAKHALISAIKLPNVAARKAAAAALASRHDSEMTQALREAAQHDPDQAVRNICVLSLSV